MAIGRRGRGAKVAKAARFKSKVGSVRTDTATKGAGPAWKPAKSATATGASYGKAVSAAAKAKSTPSGGTPATAASTTSSGTMTSATGPLRPKANAPKPTMPAKANVRAKAAAIARKPVGRRGAY